MGIDFTFFQAALEGLPLEIEGPVAVAVSGGPDSMALAYALTHWTDFEVHILSVNHGLRAAAVEEMALVEAAARDWGAVFQGFVWAHDGVVSRVQEAARAARYALMSEYCVAQGISALFLGHHRDDQAETLLFRLAKGSGLDGLAGMRPVQALEGGVSLVRPFLSVPKADLLALCAAHDVLFVEDPSNRDVRYVRGRLRAALEVEGLSSKRLSVTAERLARAQQALEEMAGRAMGSALIEKNPKRIVFDFNALKALPEEIALRLVLKGILYFRAEEIYPPRFEKVEALFEDLMRDAPFRKRTLGGVLFERDDGACRLVLALES